MIRVFVGRAKFKMRRKLSTLSCTCTNWSCKVESVIDARWKIESNLSSPNCSRQSSVARFLAIKSPRYPRRFLQSPERKSSITDKRASVNFSCRASVRLEPMKPAPPVTSKLREDLVGGTGKNYYRD